MSDQHPDGYAFQKIAAGLRARIRRGELAPGAAMPSVAELAAEHGVAPLTARAAVRILVEEGLVVSRRGTRSHVANPPSVPAALEGETQVRVHRDEAVLAIRWPQFDQWLLVSCTPGGDGEPAITTRWRPQDPAVEADGARWADPAAAGRAEAAAFVQLLRQQIDTAAQHLTDAGRGVDELERRLDGE
jgi:DNA-binding transcriptional regulator YhcF (GntR family)